MQMKEGSLTLNGMQAILQAQMPLESLPQEKVICAQAACPWPLASVSCTKCSLPYSPESIQGSGLQVYPLPLTPTVCSPLQMYEQKYKKIMPLLAYL